MAKSPSCLTQVIALSVGLVVIADTFQIPVAGCNEAQISSDFSRKVRAHSAAQTSITSSVSVSPGIVAGRANFQERGCVRSTSRRTSEPKEVPLLLQRFAPFLPAAAGPAD